MLLKDLVKMLGRPGRVFRSMFFDSGIPASMLGTIIFRRSVCEIYQVLATPLFLRALVSVTSGHKHFTTRSTMS